MKVAHISKTVKEKEKTKKELYNILDKLPPPPVQCNLNKDQLIWWNWFGNILVESGKFALPDLVHLNNAAIQLEFRNRIVKAMNKLNKESNSGVAGLVQTHGSGSMQVHPLQSSLATCNKELNNISAHFGISLRDRIRIAPPAEVDPAQTDLFNDFLNQKTS